MSLVKNSSSKVDKVDIFTILVDVMEDESFKTLFNSCFNTWDETKAIIMIMKTYQYLKLNGSIEGKSRRESVLFLKNTINDHYTREVIVQNMNNFINDIKNMEDFLLQDTPR